MLNFINLEKTHNLGHTAHTQDYAEKLKLWFSEVDIVRMKKGFWNFEEIPFPWKPRAIRLSLKKGTGECHIYAYMVIWIQLNLWIITNICFLISDIMAMPILIILLNSIDQIKPWEFQLYIWKEIKISI